MKYWYTNTFLLYYFYMYLGSISVRNCIHGLYKTLVIAMLFCIFMDCKMTLYTRNAIYGDVIILPSTRRVRIQMNQETRSFIKTAVKGNTKQYVRNPFILVILGQTSTLSHSLVVNILPRV